MIFDDGGTTLAYTALNDMRAAALSASYDSPRTQQYRIVTRGWNTTIGYAASEQEKAFTPHFAKLQRLPFEPDLWVTGAPAPSPRALGWAHAVLEQFKEISS